MSGVIHLANHKITAQSSSRQTRNTLVAGIMLALAGWAAPLSAQTASDESSESGALQEIVVTARKREERLIDVPVAVTAVTAATINQYQATDLGEIGNLVPGVSLERTQSGSSGAHPDHSRRWQSGQ